MEGEDKDITKRLKDCEEYITQSQIAHYSLLSFLTRQSRIVKKYIDILAKSYQNLFLFNFVFLVIITTFTIVELFFTILVIKALPLLIIETVTLIILIVIIILYRIDKIFKHKNFPFYITWIIYILFKVNSVLSIYIKHSESEEISSSTISKYYFYEISCHLIISFNIKLDMSLHYGHFMAFLALDISTVLLLSMTTSLYYFQSFSIITLDIFPLTQSYMTEYSNKCLFDFCVKKYYNYLKNEEIIQHSSIGICMTDENFEIIKSNSIFSNEMKDLISNKISLQMEKETQCNQTWNRNNSALQDSQEIIIKDSVFKSKYGNFFPGNGGSQQTLHNYKNILESPKKFLAIYNLYEKGIRESGGKREKDISLGQALENEVQDISTSGDLEKLRKFNYIGRFRIKSNLSLYSVHWKRVYINVPSQKFSKKMQNTILKVPTPKQSQSRFDFAETSGVKRESSQIKGQGQGKYKYKFIFTEITKNRKSDRIKIEQLYQKLILGKLSKGFTRPMELMNSIIEALKFANRANNLRTISKQSLPNLTHDLHSFSSTLIKNFQINQELDPYSQLKTYLTIVKITIEDLIEFIKIHSKNPQNEETIINRYKIDDLEDYICNMALAYMEIMEKEVKINFDREDSLDNASFEIDIQKLNQILANLLTNAIKNTSKNESINICVTKMYAKDLGYFEFPEKDVFLKKVSIKTGAEEDTTMDFGIVIKIEDSGVGVDPIINEYINRPTDNLLLAESNENKSNSGEGYFQVQGLGTGLKICKKLANELGIKLKCETKPIGEQHSGTIFKIFIKTEIKKV